MPWAERPQGKLVRELWPPRRARQPHTPHTRVYSLQDRPGMPSFGTVLRRIANVWATRRGDLAAQARWGGEGRVDSCGPLRE